MGQLKRDHSEIRACIAELKKRYAGEARSWWPAFVFHYTNLENAVSILNSNVLHSRAEALRLGLMVTDNASPSVIRYTEDKWKDFARLYFRPRTPTQFHNEGIRPQAGQSLESHCPVPIFLLFDSVDVLTRHQTQFSARSLARSQGRASTSAATFIDLPFGKIYHNTPFAAEDKDEIIACRHAEVVVPGHLDLSALRYVWCRSQAEKSTLLHLLGQDARQRWANKIFQGRKYDLFYAYWTFIERADLSASSMVFYFNPSTQTPGPFQLRVEVETPSSVGSLVYENGAFSANKKLHLQFKCNCSRYTVSVKLDGALAYKDEFIERDPIL